MSSEASPRRPRIVLVDDDKAVTDIVCYHLSHSGFEAVAVNSAPEILPTLEGFQPDVMVLDVMMPGMNGFEVLQKIRAQPGTRDLPVLMLTAVSDKRGVMVAAKLGVSGYVVKPFAPKSLIEKLEDILVQRGLPLPLLDAQTPEDDATGDSGPVYGVDHDVEVLQDIQSLDDVPTMPFIVHEVNTALKNDKLDARMLARIVEKDQGVVSQLLRFANSAHYGQTREVKTPDQAIVVLGYREVTDIVVSLSLIKGFKFPDQTSGLSQIDFWGHSFAVGTLARQIAEVVDLGRTEDVFIAGIMHDFGKFVCNLLCPSAYHETLAEVIENKTMLESVEETRLGIHHRKVGGQVGRLWDLPDLVRNAMRLHDAWKYPSIESPVERRALACIHAADRLVRAAGLGRDGEVNLMNVDSAVWEDLRFKASGKDADEAVKNTMTSWARFMNSMDLVDLESAFEDTTFLNPEVGDDRPPVLVIDERQRPMNSVVFSLMSSKLKPVYKTREANYIQYLRDHREIEGIIVTGRDPDLAKNFFHQIRECPVKNIADAPILYIREIGGGSNDEATLAPEIAQANGLVVLQEPYTRDDFHATFSTYREAFLKAYHA